MNYFEVITADRTWVCPKSGIYKIIAVGGGSASKLLVYSKDLSKRIQPTAGAGGNTSFGNLITAKGGFCNLFYSEAIVQSFYSRKPIYGGAGGYTLNQYGGVGGICFDTSKDTSTPPTINGGNCRQPGMGYGGGGSSSGIGLSCGYSYRSGTSSNTGNIVVCAAESASGELNELICDLTEGLSINCVVGAGGALTSNDFESIITECVDNVEAKLSRTAYEFGGFSCDVSKFLSTIDIKDYIPGRSGCIVVEYLGESL